MRRFALVLLASLTLLLAGCTDPASPPDGDPMSPPPDGDDGDGDGDGDGADGGDGDTGDGDGDGDDLPPSGPDATWREQTYLGSILVGRDGHTLYVFTRDGPNEATCTDSCAQVWPPAIVQDEETEGEGELADRLGTITHEDGVEQLTIDERPLYRFVSDEEPGEVNGQGRLGAWYVVRENEHAGQVTADILDGPGDYNITSSEVSYHANTTGYLAQPTGQGPFPGVVVIPEWWGLNDNIRRMTDALASHGYHALAVDFYDDEVADEPATARELMQSIDQDNATENMRAAVAHLRDEAGATSVGSVGWCFGGGQSLQLALSGEPMDATVIYYGSPVTDEQRLEVIDWPLQGIFAAEDASISVESVEAFDRALDNVSVEHEITIYEEVGHAFANPSGDAYAPEEAMEAWASTLRFLDEHL